MENNQSLPAEQFFDLHVRGMGYLNRVRVVPIKRGKPYLACTIAALRGCASEPEKTYFDCSVVGEEAISLIEQYSTICNRQKVMMGFKLGDLWLDKFTYATGDKTGQEGIMLKARLLLIDWIKVDGEVQYRRANLESIPEQVQPPAPIEANASGGCRPSSLDPLI